MLRRHTLTRSPQVVAHLGKEKMGSENFRAGATLEEQDILSKPSLWADLPALKSWCWASLLAQWQRVHMPVQEIWVQPLIQEDSTCCETTKLVCNNYWACGLEPGSHIHWAHVLQVWKPQRPRAHALEHEKPPQWEARARQMESDNVSCSVVSDSLWSCGF